MARNKIVVKGKLIVDRDIKSIRISNRGIPSGYIQIKAMDLSNKYISHMVKIGDSIVKLSIGGNVGYLQSEVNTIVMGSCKSIVDSSKVITKDCTYIRDDEYPYFYKLYHAVENDWSDIGKRLRTKRGLLEICTHNWIEKQVNSDYTTAYNETDDMSVDREFKKKTSVITIGGPVDEFSIYAVTPFDMNTIVNGNVTSLEVRRKDICISTIKPIHCVVMRDIIDKPMYYLKIPVYLNKHLVKYTDACIMQVNKLIAILPKYIESKKNEEHKNIWRAKKLLSVVQRVQRIEGVAEKSKSIADLETPKDALIQKCEKVNKSLLDMI